MYNTRLSIQETQYICCYTQGGRQGIQKTILSWVTDDTCNPIGIHVPTDNDASYRGSVLHSTFDQINDLIQRFKNKYWVAINLIIKYTFKRFEKAERAEGFKNVTTKTSTL